MKTSEIKDIPADKLTAMTHVFHKAFNIAGCDPACHCCWNKIKPGNKFKLSTVKEINVNNTGLLENANKDASGFTKSVEVMLCHKCTPEMFYKKELAKIKKGAEWAKNQPAHKLGCFRINGEVIH